MYGKVINIREGVPRKRRRWAKKAVIFRIQVIIMKCFKEAMVLLCQLTNSKKNALNGKATLKKILRNFLTVDIK